MFWTPVKQITPQSAKDLIDLEGALAVDVRKPKDYAKSHVEGAVNAEVKTVVADISEENKDRPIVCYCYGGYASRQACKRLTKAGFQKVYSINWGYWGWNRAFRKE